jgi:hypothetical protein
MFFKSKLFNFLLPLAAYILFAFQWLYYYTRIWYGNVPEETQYFTRPNMGFYMIYAWVLAISFFLFLIFGIIYLVKKPVPAYIRYIIMVILFVSSYFLWHYSTLPKGWQQMGLLQFGNLILFAVSIFKVSKQ